VGDEATSASATTGRWTVSRARGGSVVSGDEQGGVAVGGGSHITAIGRKKKLGHPSRYRLFLLLTKTLRHAWSCSGVNV
jgi:hypothetical protein